VLREKQRLLPLASPAAALVVNPLAMHPAAAAFPPQLRVAILPASVRSHCPADSETDLQDVQHLRLEAPSDDLLAKRWKLA